MIIGGVIIGILLALGAWAHARWRQPFAWASGRTRQSRQTRRRRRRSEDLGALVATSARYGKVVAVNVVGKNPARVRWAGVEEFEGFHYEDPRDAAAIAERLTPEQREALGERIPRDPDHGFAMWSDDPDDPDVAAWKQRQVEHARHLAAQGHSRAKLAAEIRE